MSQPRISSALGARPVEILTGDGWTVLADLAEPAPDRHDEPGQAEHGPEGGLVPGSREADLARVDTEVEIEYLQNGGVLHYVLRNLARA